MWLSVIANLLALLKNLPQTPCEPKRALDHQALHCGVLEERFAHSVATRNDDERVQHNSGGLCIRHPGIYCRHEHGHRWRAAVNRVTPPGAGMYAAGLGEESKDQRCYSTTPNPRLDLVQRRFLAHDKHCRLRM